MKLGERSSDVFFLALSKACKKIEKDEEKSEKLKYKLIEESKKELGIK